MLLRVRDCNKRANEPAPHPFYSPHAVKLPHHVYIHALFINRGVLFCLDMLPTPSSIPPIRPAGVSSISSLALL
eukprot:762498-Hanusia_phi.AAC.3